MRTLVAALAALTISTAQAETQAEAIMKTVAHSAGLANALQLVCNQPLVNYQNQVLDMLVRLKPALVVPSMREISSQQDAQRAAFRGTSCDMQSANLLVTTVSTLRSEMTALEAELKR